MTDCVEDFRAAAERAGVFLAGELIADGRLHRVHSRGDSPGSRNAWYVLHSDLQPAGRFGSWKLGLSESWVARAPANLTPAERAENARRMAAAQAGREAEQARAERAACRRAAYIWKDASPADPTHPYLVRKGVGVHGLRYYRGFLVLPLYDAGGALHSLQFIGRDGAKKFLRNGRVQGCFATLKPGEVWPAALYRLYVAEGFATGASVQEVTGETVVVAFNSGNLLAVALAVRAKLPGVDLIICADNDQWTAGNPGLTKAAEAARAARGRLAVPHFRDTSTKPTDFNDLFRLRGRAAVESQLLAARFLI
jgi:putative DNA primase/helicase